MVKISFVSSCASVLSRFSNVFQELYKLEHFYLNTFIILCTMSSRINLEVERIISPSYYWTRYRANTWVFPLIAVKKNNDIYMCKTDTTRKCNYYLLLMKHIENIMVVWYSSKLIWNIVLIILNWIKLFTLLQYSLLTPILLSFTTSN